MRCALASSACSETATVLIFGQRFIEFCKKLQLSTNDMNVAALRFLLKLVAQAEGLPAGGDPPGAPATIAAAGSS